MSYLSRRSLHCAPLGTLVTSSIPGHNEPVAAAEITVAVSSCADSKPPSRS